MQYDDDLLDACDLISVEGDAVPDDAPPAVRAAAREAARAVRALLDALLDVEMAGRGPATGAL